LKVVDASVIVELLAYDLDPARLGDEELAAPHLVDTEVLNVLRRLVAHGVLSGVQGADAIDGFGRLTLTRFPADWLRQRMWELRQDLSAYDATYVALAEVTNATSLLTTDSRLANAPGVGCPVEVL
jgi:predicted nucleic acid-binding protein